MYVCACSCSDNFATLFEEVERKAAKEHECFECGETIGIGEKHMYASSLYDGHWSHWRTCILCHRIATDLCGGCYDPGHLWEDIWETNGLHPHEAPNDTDGWRGGKEDR